MSEHKREAGPRQAGTPEEWSELFCTCGWCRGKRWLARRDPRAPELWEIAEAQTHTPWAVAAQRPVCPLCGEELDAHAEGVGEPELAADNPFVGYIGSISRAA